MCVAISPLPQTSSWCGALLSTGPTSSHGTFPCARLQDGPRRSALGRHQRFAKCSVVLFCACQSKGGVSSVAGSVRTLNREKSRPTNPMDASLHKAELRCILTFEQLSAVMMDVSCPSVTVVYYCLSCQ
jgi:hypothetical protein